MIIYILILLIFNLKSVRPHRECLIFAHSLTLYIVSGIFAVTIFPIGLTRIRSCCPAFVLIPVYELSGTFSKFIAKKNLSTR